MAVPAVDTGSNGVGPPGPDAAGSKRLLGGLAALVLAIAVVVGFLVANNRSSDAVGNAEADSPSTTEVVVSTTVPLLDVCAGTGTSLGVDDCVALSSLVESELGSSWVREARWEIGVDPCFWNGWVCTLGKLTGLDVREYPVSPGVPPQLGGFSNLEELLLNFGFDADPGEIPSELGQLSNLRVLVLESSGFTGEIPPELGQLSNLTDLGLSLNPLAGEIPRELGQLSELEILSLNITALSGEIPPELGELSNLRELGLSSSQLSGEIPSELGQLSELEVLVVGDNELSGEIPPELAELSNLWSLHLDNNQLSGEIPTGLDFIEDLRTDGNQLTR